MIGGKHSVQKPTALGAMLNASTYGMTIPNIYGLTKSNILVIWLANLREGGSSKKGKKKGAQTFVANCDFLLGSNPIRYVLQMWGDNNKRYKLDFASYTIPSFAFKNAESVFPIPDDDFYAVVAVTADQVLSGTFNDYGGQGAVPYSGTYEIPLWNATDHGPDLIQSGVSRWWPYVYYWTPSFGANIQLPWMQTFFSPSGGLPFGNGNVHIYYAKIAEDSGGKGKGASLSPLAQLRLNFEQPLGSGTEYADAGLSGQQIQYPYYAGLESSDLDLGSSGMIPALRAEVQGSFSLYQRGDADFMDMFEDIIKSGQLQTGVALGEIHRGVNLNELPGAIQKNQYQNLEPTTVVNLKYQQPVGVGNVLIGFVKWRSTAGGTAPSINSTGLEAWIPIGLGGSGINWGAWYTTAAVADETVTFTSGGTGGFNYDTRPFIIEMDPGSQNILGTATNSGTAIANGRATCQITVNVPAGQPVYLLGMLAATQLAQNVDVNRPYHWNNLFPSTINDISGASLAYRLVHGPGTYTISWPLTSGGDWSMNLIAITQANPVSYAKPLGSILEPTTLQATRDQCRANGLIGSLTMNSQKPASAWLDDLLKCANAAPVWSGFRLKVIPWSEVSAVGNGAVYNAYTAAGPVADLGENDFIGDAGTPILSIERKAQVDAPNIKQIQHIDRDNDYNPVVTSQVEQAISALYAPRKDQPQAIDAIQSPAVARMILGIQARRESYIKNTYKGKLQQKWFMLEPMDLVTVTEPLLGIFGLPMRITKTSEDENYNIDVEFEDFFYGVHSPTAVPVTTTAPFSTPSGDTAGFINPPIIFEPIPRLTNNSPELWLVISGPSTNFGGGIVYLSTDGGDSYNLLPNGIQGKAATGVNTSDWPAANDPDTANNLPLDLTESLGTLDSFQVADEDNFTYPCFIGAEIVMLKAAPGGAQNTGAGPTIDSGPVQVNIPNQTLIEIAYDQSNPADSFVLGGNPAGGWTQRDETVDPSSGSLAAFDNSVNAGTYNQTVHVPFSNAMYSMLFAVNGLGAFLQSNHNSGISVSSLTITFTSPVQAGDFIFLAAGKFGSHAQPTSVQDNFGNTYLLSNQLGFGVPFGSNLSCWWAVAKSGGTLTITVQYAATSIIDLVILNYRVKGNNGLGLAIPYELMTYATANLTGSNLYTLAAIGNKLRRSVFGAPQPLSGVDHPINSRWAFLNPNGRGILKLPFDTSWIGKTLYFKILSFNSFGGGVQSLANADAYPYMPTGGPAASFNPNVNNYRVLGGALAQPCATPTQITMAQATVAFPSNSVNYNARTFTIPTPTAPTTYYITILDPQYVGDTGALTNLLSFADTAPSKVGQPGYIYMGALLALPAGCGVQTAPGGMPATLPEIMTSKPATVIALTPGADGNFTVAHGLGVTPSFVLISMSSGAKIWLQSPTSFNSTSIFLTSSDASATGFAIVWTTPADEEVSLAPGAAGNFTIAHGLGSVPQLAMVEMLDSSQIWFQSTPWDATNLYLTASDDASTGKAEVLGAHSAVVAPVFARVALAPSNPGNFTVAHGLGVTPIAVVFRLDTGGLIWLQSPTGFDGTNLFLTASAGGLTGEALIWA